MDEHRFEEYMVGMLTEDDGSYFAELVELPGCYAAGADANDAVEMLRGSFGIWTDEMRAQGRAVPEPFKECEASGRFLLRMPTGLHSRASREAARQGVSLNQYVNVVLAEALGFAEGARSSLEGASLAGEHGPRAVRGR